MLLELMLTLAAILLLLILSAFFSGSETALTAASKARMYSLEMAGDKRAGIVNALRALHDRLIGTILIGNNLVNILASALTTSLFISLFGPAGVAYATLALTALVVIFSEILPKTYALANPERSALAVAPLLRPVILVLAPLSAAAVYIVRRILRILGLQPDEEKDLLSAHEELRGAIDLHHKEGGVVKHDRDMLGGILDLRDLDVEDIMVHRTKVQLINADDPPEMILEEVLKSAYTRFPLWRDELENIVGILHIKDVLRALTKVKGNVEDLDIPALANDPWFIPETTSLVDQLNAFLRRKTHFALVVDEYGEVMGLVTLEDILEEIVGDITDEHDATSDGIRPQPDGSINVDGSEPIRDVNRIMEWALPEDEATTIAGLVIHTAQTIPEPGQAFTFYGFRFEILRRQRNKITALRITPLSGKSEKATRSTA